MRKKAYRVFTWKNLNNFSFNIFFLWSSKLISPSSIAQKPRAAENGIAIKLTNEINWTFINASLKFTVNPEKWLTQGFDDTQYYKISVANANIIS